ncbi:MAG: hypothetical protein ACP5MT_01215 [Candidatus Acidifodinimicrobium sp.]
MGKIVFLIVDGMGDHPIKLLSNKTPLEYANKVNINSLLPHAVLAFPSVLGRLAPESDSGVMADLGYDPKKYSTGRGWFECLGLGMEPREGDISLRVNIAEAVGSKLKSVRTYLSKEEFAEIEKVINEQVKLPLEFEFKAGEGYRGGLIIRDEKKRLSQFISNNEPGYTVKFFGDKKLSFASKSKSDLIPKIKALKSSAVFTEKILNQFISEANRVLLKTDVYKKRKSNSLPLPNYVLLRDGAIHDPKLPDINKKYGKQWAAVVGMPLEKGIASAAGMSLMKITELSDLDEDLENKADSVSRALDKYDAVYVHVKQTDALSHLGKYVEKYDAIERIDRILVYSILQKIDVSNGDTVVITCDHRTSSELKRHTNDNIPVLIANRKFNRVKDFGETECKKHHLKNISKATEIMPFVMKL